MKAHPIVQKKIAELNKALEKKTADTRKEIDALSSLDELSETELPDAPLSVHYHPLWGTVGELSFSQVRPSEVRKLIELFPPTDKAKVKDSCVSFRPDLGERVGVSEHVDILPVFPVTIDVGTLHGAHAKYRWYTQLKNGELWRVEASTPQVGYYDQKRVKYWTDKLCTVRVRHSDCSVSIAGNSPDGCLIHSTSIQLTDHMKGWTCIQWSSGGRQYPSTFTLYQQKGNKVEDMWLPDDEGTAP